MGLSTVSFTYGKLAELFISLLFISSLGAFGILIAFVLGAIVFFLISKFVMKEGSTIMVLSIALIVTLLLMVGLKAALG
jgi:hypothetical protein